MGKRMSQETETELRGSATKNGQQTQSSEPDKIIIRDASQIQAATRTELESLSSYVADQLNEAVVTRSAEKLALHAVQNSDRIVTKAIGHLQSFLPKILEPNPLMFENELEILMGSEAA
jgi:hypothetical protein